MVDPVILQALWRGLKHLRLRNLDVGLRKERLAGFGGRGLGSKLLEENFGWWQEAKKSPEGLRHLPSDPP